VLKSKGVNGNQKPEKKSFNDYLAETIERNADRIRNRRPFTGSAAREDSFDMFTEEEKKAFTETVEGKVETKAVGDMSLSANFPGASGLYTDVRNNLLELPANRVYLADLLPNSTSNGMRVGYPKENAVREGGVSTWNDYSTNKSQVDFDLVPAYSDFVWGAGFVVIQRDMLDNIPFMISYLQDRLLLSLKTWENSLIINGATSETGSVIPGFQTVASPYNGSLTAAVDRALDAGLGQIPDATSDYYFGTHIIVRRRDLVQKFMLNKSTGSGEYDLPDNAVTYNADGTVNIGTLKVVGTTGIPFNTFYAFDNRSTAFIRRIQPELRMFEDATLAKKNQIMWRIEERATVVVFRNDAIVKGVLANS
jgi:HK97 family phage major capsid protein